MFKLLHQQHCQVKMKTYKTKSSSNQLATTAKIYNSISYYS